MDGIKAWLPPLAGAAAGLALLAASPEHAKRHDLDQCRQEAAGTAEAPDGDSSAGTDMPTPAEIDEIDACMRSKGYMRVHDTEGLCDLAVILQCFERAR
jgi:hypothetical protein